MKITQPKNFPIVLAFTKDVDEFVLAKAAVGLRRGLEFARTISMREFLSGPRPAKLDVISGRLRNSVAIDVKASDKGVVGRIGSNVKYAKFHEFGFEGSVNVRSHTRHIEDKLAGGGTRGVKLIRDRAGNVVGQKRESLNSAAARGVEFMEQTVKAHTRKLNYKGRPFIKPALVKAQPLIKQAVLEEIAKVRPPK